MANLPTLSRDLLEVIKAIDLNKTEVIPVNASRLVLSGLSADELPKESYNVCSGCYSFIEQTWDHKEWCSLYEEEALVRWIRKGQKRKIIEKNT